MGKPQFDDVKRYHAGGGCRPHGIESVGDEPITPLNGDDAESELRRQQQAKRNAVEAWHKAREEFMLAAPPVAATIRVPGSGAAEVEIFPDAKHAHKVCATVRVLADLDTYPNSNHGHCLRTQSDRPGGFIVFLDAPSVSIVQNLAGGKDRITIEKLAIRITSVAQNGKSGRGAIVTFKA